MAKLIIGVNDLVTTHPELAKEWNYEKNEKTPQDYTASSGVKVWWKCKNNHAYQAIINRRKYGIGCPFCAGQKVLLGFNDLATVNPELTKEWNYEKNEKTPQDYTSGSGVKVWWKCEKGHEWQATIFSRNKGHRCPYCSNRLVKQGFNDLVTTHPKLVKEWNYDKNIDSPQDYTSGSHQKVWWKCNKGHEWQTSIVSRASNASMCPYCGNNKVLQGYNDLSITNPELLTEWNYVKNGIVTPQIVSKGSEKKVWWVCEKGHEYQADIGHRVRVQGCPYCTGQRILQGFNDLITTKPELIKEWNYAKNGNLLPNMVMPSSHTKVWWICKNGHEWLSALNNRTKGRSCPYCNGSKSERLSYQILKELNISFVAEKKFTQDKYISFYPYDIWIASKKLIIELDGIQHFQEVDYFEESKPFQERRKTDNLKNNYCLDKKIPILRIPYTYNPDTKKDKIQQLVKDFVEIRKVPDEIIEFYEPYKKDNNYAKVARKLNKLLES